jgi:hypothetical protein
LIPYVRPILVYTTRLQRTHFLSMVFAEQAAKHHANRSDNAAGSGYSS